MLATSSIAQTAACAAQCHTDRVPCSAPVVPVVCVYSVYVVSVAVVVYMTTKKADATASAFLYAFSALLLADLSRLILIGLAGLTSLQSLAGLITGLATLPYRAASAGS